MAQNIKLKRSSVAGKVPTAAQLEAGEIAINTADGKLYFERDDSTIQTIVTTNAVITGSLNINGPVTASFFKGDGSAITGIISSSYALTASYAANVPQTASYALTALSASYAATASSADNFIIRTALTASGLHYPAADATYANQHLLSDGSGDLFFGDPTTFYETIYNGETTTLVKGTPVYISGSQGANPIVYRADAANPAKMPVTYIISEDILTASTGRGIVLGLISGIDLTGYIAGQEVFVAPGGGWTATRPTGSAIVQFLGVIAKPNSGGKGLVLNPGPATLPNLTSGNAWVGDSSSYPIAVSTASFYVTQAVSASLAASATTASYALKAESVGQLNQNVVVNGNLTVFGTSSFTYVTSSQLNVDDSFISVNVFEPAERFGGIKVYDSGSLSHLATASLAWDSQRNHWVYTNASGSTYSGGGLMSGPRNTGSLGDETYPTHNTVLRGQGGDHLYDSNIKDNDVVVQVGIPLQVTGSLTTTGKVNIETVDNYGSDPDKFLAIVSNEVVYRTGAQLLSDIGGQTAGTFVQNSGAGGVARYIMRYADSNSATTSSIYENTTGYIGINTINPSAPLDVNGNTVVSGSLTVVGNTTAIGGVTGSLLGNASTATSASFLALNAQYGEEFTIISNTPNQLTLYRPSGNTVTAAFDVSLATTASYVTFANVANKPTLVSGSAQINLAQATGTAANATSASYAIFATSAGSATSAATATSASFASTAPFTGITGKPTLVSGSEQINLSQATGTAATATSASFATYANSAGSATSATNATNATYINVSEKNDNVDYQVLFSTTNGTGNQSIYIDTDDTHLTYNPSTRTLTSATFIGNLTGNADTATALTSGNKTITGNLTVTGKVTAEEFHTEFVSSSIIFSSGSTKFGDDSNDVHSFTGSLNLNTLNNATTDTDRFIVSDGGTLKYRTGAEILSDIGAQASGNYVTDAGGAIGQVAVWSSATAMSGSDGLYWSGTNLGINNPIPTYNLHVAGTVAATALVETSARKFKEGIEPVVDALNTVTQLQGVTFVRIGEENREYGFIADEVADVAPALVSYDENGNPYGVQYARTVAIQNEAIKELNDKVNSQELFIRDLLRRIEKLENK